MPKVAADDLDLDEVETILKEHRLKHVRVRKRGDSLTLVEGPAPDPVPMARLRRITSQYWTLDMPAHTGKWERVPVRDTLPQLVHYLIREFGWTLASRAPRRRAERTSDPEN
ncbi:MAG: hypothetical protein IT379_31495 [Deltaproteobacteria bacterium]|nr:hypothetical protein [Deltaproteobacteria bacterium]